MNPTPRYCKGCDYDLSAASDPVCPECGRAFAPDDPRSYRAFSRRSWRGRWCRWRWVLPVLLLIGVVWPRGWVLTRFTWTDPRGAGSAGTSALVIGKPWWVGGWWPPMTWSTTDGGDWKAPSTNAPIVMADAMWMSNGALWYSRFLGQGKLAVVAPTDTLSDEFWAKQIKAYVHDAATTSASASAQSRGMVISAPVPPWAESPTAPLR